MEEGKSVIDDMVKLVYGRGLCQSRGQKNVTRQWVQNRSKEDMEEGKSVIDDLVKLVYGRGLCRSRGQKNVTRQLVGL